MERDGEAGRTEAEAAASGPMLGMMLDLALDLESSALLRASVDERFFRLWDYRQDGEFIRHRAQKDEFERRVKEILYTTEASLLRSLAEKDRALIRGSTLRGPEPFDPLTGDLAVIAARQLELELVRARRTLGDAAYAPASPVDRVCHTVPGLFDRLSGRDRLLTLTPEMVRDRRGAHDRVFCLGEFAVFPHPALRPARELVQDLCALAEEGFAVQVAIDPHAVVPDGEIVDVMLLDYWYGLKLRLAGLDDPTAVGTTRHGRRPELNDRYLFPLLWTDFRWKAEGTLKTLEVQETVPREPGWGNHDGARYGRSQFVVNRYLHSLRDTNRRQFIHLDGAAKAFPECEYKPTTADPIDEQGTPVYRKLFRVDGNIPDRDSGRLVAHFFRENELVIEYFGEVLDERPGAAAHAA